MHIFVVGARAQSIVKRFFMKQLSYGVGFVFFVASLVGRNCKACDENSVDYLGMQDEGEQEVLWVTKKTLHLEEKIKYLDDKIEELEESAEGYHVFQESFAVGVLGALAMAFTDNMKVGIPSIVAGMLLVDYIKGRVSSSHLTSKMIGALLGTGLFSLFKNTQLECQW